MSCPLETNPITGILLPDPTCSIGAFGVESHRFKTCQVWPQRPVEILLRPTSSDVHNSAGFVRTHGEFSQCQLRVYSPLCCLLLFYFGVPFLYILVVDYHPGGNPIFNPPGSIAKAMTAPRGALSTMWSSGKMKFEGQDGQCSESGDLGTIFKGPQFW